jgi:hypothetical protein
MMELKDMNLLRMFYRVSWPTTAILIMIRTVNLMWQNISQHEDVIFKQNVGCVLLFGYQKFFT